MQISISGLLAAGIIPALLVGIFLMITAFLYSFFRGYGEIHRFEGSSCKRNFWCTSCFGYTIFDPVWHSWWCYDTTEAGAIAALYSHLGFHLWHDKWKL